MVFISYSWADKEKVHPICVALSKEFGENKIFYDDRMNKTGSDYWPNIEKGLKNSKYFIFFNSVNYKNSAGCGNELLIALDHQKTIKIIEIKLDSTKSHNALEKKIYLNYSDAYKIDKLIKVIQYDDFSELNREKLITNIEYEIHNNSSMLVFQTSSTINNPRFIFVKENKSKMEINYLFNKAATKGSSGTLDTEEHKKLFYQVSNHTGLQLSSGNKYKIEIKNFNKEHFFDLGIYDAEKGSIDKLGSYEWIFGLVNING